MNKLTVCLGLLLMLVACLHACNKFPGDETKKKEILGKCVYVHTKQKCHEEASEFCENEGTHLVVLDTQEKHDALSTYMTGEQLPNQFWTSGQIKDGKFQWVNSEEDIVEQDASEIEGRFEGTVDFKNPGNNNYVIGRNGDDNKLKTCGPDASYLPVCEEN